MLKKVTPLHQLFKIVLSIVISISLSTACQTTEKTLTKESENTDKIVFTIKDYSHNLVLWEVCITQGNYDEMARFAFHVEQLSSKFASRMSYEQWMDDFQKKTGKKAHIEGFCFSLSEIETWVSQRCGGENEKVITALLKAGILQKTDTAIRSNSKFRDWSLIGWSCEEKDRATLFHEISHVRWDADIQYRDMGKMWWEALDDSVKEQFIDLLSPKGYRPFNNNHSTDESLEYSLDFIDEVVAYYFTATLNLPSEHHLHCPIIDLNQDGVDDFERYLWSCNENAIVFVTSQKIFDAQMNN